MNQFKTNIKAVGQYLIDNGLLFEINRAVLHPLGLALAVQVSSDNEIVGMELRKTNDLDGLIYDEETLKECTLKRDAFMEREGHLRLNQRAKSLGYIIQDGIGTFFEPLNFATLQVEHRAWEAHNFGDQQAYRSFLGIVEELGELAHCILKGEQNIRGSQQEFDAKAQDAIGDITVFLASYCNKRNWDYQSIIESVWGEVKNRDWKKYPKNGLSE